LDYTIYSQEAKEASFPIHM